MNARIRLLATLIAATLIAGVGTLGVRSQSGPETIRVTAMFSKTIGLFPSSRVDVLGVSVGRVVSVTPVGNDVKVVMQIDRARKIPADARATIVPISLISDRYVQLFPPYQSGAVMADGAHISTDRTYIPAELDDLLTQLKKLLDALQAGASEGSPALGTLIHNLSRALRATGPDLAATLSGGGKVATTVLARSSDLDQIVDHLSSIVTAIAQRRDDLVNLNTNLAQALGAIAGERDSLAGVLVNIDLLTDQLSGVVHDHRADLETDLSIAAKTTAAVIRQQASLERTLQWLPVLDDGVENGHNGGIVHTDASPVHIDVRDSHFTTCPPGVPAGVCVLLGLNGTPLSMPAAASAPGNSGGEVEPATPEAPPDAPPDPANLLGLLGDLPLLNTTASPTPSSSPGGLEDLFSGLGGALDRALRWIW